MKLLVADDERWIRKGIIKMIDLEREKALNDLRASVTGLAMTATAKLLSEQAGPESDKKRYQAFLASAGEKHD